MGVNDRIQNWFEARQVDLIRTSNAQENALLRGVFRDVDENLAGFLSLVQADNITPTRMRSILDRIDRILLPQGPVLTASMATYIQGLTAAEMEAVSALMGRVFAPIDIEPRPVPDGARRSAARTRRIPMLGSIPALWRRTLLRNDRERVRRETVSGIQRGDRGRTLVAAVVGSPSLRLKDGVREVTRRGVRTMFQTLTEHAATQSRSLWYETHPELVREERWVARLDGRTSGICRGLDGKTFEVGKGIQPPAHPNCRSARIPIVPNLRALPAPDKTILPSSVKESFDGSLPEVLTYDRWLRQRSTRFQRNVLGPTRFRLWRTGRIKLDRFINDRGVELTVDQLRAKVPGLFDEVGL